MRKGARMSIMKKQTKSTKQVAQRTVRIPGHADQRSGLMVIAIPG